jgi:hypothetical protein
MYAQFVDHAEDENYRGKYHDFEPGEQMTIEEIEKMRRSPKDPCKPIIPGRLRSNKNAPPAKGLAKAKDSTAFVFNNENIAWHYGYGGGAVVSSGSGGCRVRGDAGRGGGGGN